LDIELRFFIRNIPDTPVIRNDVRFAILDAFREHGIEIPFPQRDVHMKSD
jgi:small-conductance mechanosensitive channel